MNYWKLGSLPPFQVIANSRMRRLRFLADSMLGKLTRWLRMLGHDTTYANHLDDKTLAKMAKAEERVLLTRDLELYRLAKARQVQVFLVEERSKSEQLAVLSQRFNLALQLDPNSSRCPRCNAKISTARKDSICAKIPSTTARVYDEFWECLNCKKIYWQGAHWKKITETLRAARMILEE